MATEISTRDRILEAALSLFAEHGFAGTSVGEIEAAAGLSPRSGALYKHFPSKEAVLEAAFAERMEAVDEFNRRLEMAPLDDLRAELTLIARWGLAELRRERSLVRVIMRDGARRPELTQRFYAAIVQRSLALSRAVLDRIASERGLRIPDPDALAAGVHASLVGFSLQQILFGDGFADVDDERFAAAWVATTLAAIESAERSEVNV
jgi:AcrR family transcriptional regulator